MGNDTLYDETTAPEGAGETFKDVLVMARIQTDSGTYRVHYSLPVQNTVNDLHTYL